MAISPERLINEGTEAMKGKDYAIASAKFQEARSGILEELKASTAQRRATLEILLESLDGNGEPGVFGRIESAQDYKNRINGLERWMRTNRIPQGADKPTRRLAFHKARFDLAMSSLIRPMQEPIQRAVETIAGKERNEEYYKISEVVFSFVWAILDAIDKERLSKSEEPGEPLVQYSTGIDSDPSFAKEKNISRSKNPLATEERISKKYERILHSPYTRNLLSENKALFAELMDEVGDLADMTQDSRSFADIRNVITTGHTIIPIDFGS